MFAERSSLKLLRLAALNFYSLQDVQFSLADSEIVSLLYIANYFSVRVAMVLINYKIKPCRFCLSPSITKLPITRPYNHYRSRGLAACRRDSWQSLDLSSLLYPAAGVVKGAQAV